ncbi:alpha/beta fold hydrolase [Oleiagrimonas sp. C23AA]|uniref:YheT family hydrolase n=1 Tax=Oleiagrimonas sp. C23AA TaxID=2719047 RepID=UPI0031B672A0
MLSSSGMRRLWQRSHARAAVHDGAEAVTFTLSDGVRLSGAVTRQKVRQKARGLLILFHGWEGSIDSTYVLQTGARMLADGWDIFRLNFRDHGATHHLNTELFHSCLIDEVVEATAEATLRYLPYEGAPLGLVGFSLGGSFALRVALRAPGAGIPLSKTVVVCPIIDPHAGLRSLETAIWIYEWYFMHKWRGSLKRKAQVHPQHRYFEPRDLRHNMRELTRVLVERHTDFGSLDAYLDGYSVGVDRLAQMQVPTTILTSEDDPVIPVADFHDLNLSEAVELDISRYGGHCGYIQDWRMNVFTDDYIAARLNACAQD